MGSEILFASSSKTRPLVHLPVSGNRAGRRLRLPWMAAVVALALGAVLLLAACGGGEENELLELVPKGASLIAEIEVADILEKVDLDSLTDALPAGEGGPQTIDEVLELAANEIGIDLRDVSRVIFFGDLQRENDYFGFIGRGAFDEERLVVSLEGAISGPLFTETYKGRDLHISRDDYDDFAFTLLDKETLVIGTPEAVRHVIDVQEGDRNRAEGATYDAFSDLPSGLIRLALAVPPEASQDLGSEIEGFLGQEDNLGGLTINVDSLDKLEILGFALGQDGDALKFQLRMGFADRQSASKVGDLMDGLLIVAGSLESDEQALDYLDRIQVDRSGNTLALRFEIVAEELDDLLEGILSLGTGGFPEGNQAAKDAEWDRVQTAIDIMMVDLRVTSVTASGVTAVKITGSLGGQDLSPYLRGAETTYCYTWDTTGKLLTQTEC